VKTTQIEPLIDPEFEAAVKSTEREAKNNYDFKKICRSINENYASGDREQLFAAVMKVAANRARYQLWKRFNQCDAHTVDELTQVATLKVLEKFDSYKPAAQFSFWVKVVIENALQDYFDEQTRHNEVCDSISDHQKREEDTYNGTAKLEHHEACMDRLRYKADEHDEHDIAAMEARAERVNSLCFMAKSDPFISEVMKQMLAGMGEKEIAVKMGIKEGVLKCRLQRFREKCEKLSPPVYRYQRKARRKKVNKQTDTLCTPAVQYSARESESAGETAQPSEKKTAA
jgi:RNA polymerase sigma factor (sigma-70 family)